MLLAHWSTVKKVLFGLMWGVIAIMALVVALLGTGTLSKRDQVIAADPDKKTPAVYVLQWVNTAPFDSAMWMYVPASTTTTTAATTTTTTTTVMAATPSMFKVDATSGDLIVCNTTGATRMLDLSPVIDFNDKTKNIVIMFDVRSAEGTVKFDYNLDNKETDKVLDIHYTKQGVDILRNKDGKKVYENMVMYSDLSLPVGALTKMNTAYLRFRVILDRQDNVVRLDMAIIEDLKSELSPEYMSLLRDVPYTPANIFNRFYLLQGPDAANYFNRLMIMQVQRNNVPYY
jgi:hypothetical protein